MAAVARALGVDRVVTGHPCSAIAPIAGSLNQFVDIGGINVAVQGDIIAPHTILAGKFCVPHTAFINTGSTFVSISTIPMARIGDSADLGVVCSGSPFVWAL